MQSVCPMSRACASQAWGGQSDWESAPTVAEVIGGSWGGTGRALGLPLQDFSEARRGEGCSGVRGQAQGLPLRDA